MTEQPANIARLRRRYLSLLLVHPYAKESKDVENHLWMQTSYAFIASYKQRILNLDRIIQSKLRQQQQPAQRPNNVPIVEHRKILQRFRQFLADEEKFWSQVVVRLRRSFALDEAAPALVALGIVTEAEEAVVEGSDGGVPPNGRNHFQFPPEEASTPFRPTNADEKALWLAILSKALVCLGDIARYRELYNEAGGRPKAGQEDTGFSRRSRNRRGGHSSEEPAPRPRNYEKAEQCYQQARLLVPGDGNPSHQLAIIATYRKDSFTSLTHYYRALCVRTPYDTASENLGSVLGKALEAWKTRSRRERDRQDALPPRVQVETFRENIVVLHSLWKVGMEKGLKKCVFVSCIPFRSVNGRCRMDALSRRHNKVVHDAFTTLLSQRYLPIDMISNSVVLSQGALWKHRMVRTLPNVTQNRRPEVPPPPEGTSVIIEWHILEHLLDLHRGLLEVGTEELRVPPPRDAPGDDLAQRITATFRRSLPALRIASKWLKANFKYLTLDHEFAAYQQTKRLEGVEVVRNPKYQFSRTSRRTIEFWESYSRFASDLSRTFNLYKIPPLTAPLEEDIEMRGFLPLKNMMDSVSPVEGRNTSGVLAEEAHPNDWQLMRIADLIEDAKGIAKLQSILQNSPITVFAVNHYTFNRELVEPQQVGRTDAAESGGQDHLLASIRDTRQSRLNQDDDNMTEITSRTDDDVLRDAFQFLHASPDGDDEGDEIVWDPRPTVTNDPCDPGDTFETSKEPCKAFAHALEGDVSIPRIGGHGSRRIYDRARSSQRRPQWPSHPEPFGVLRTTASFALWRGPFPSSKPQHLVHSTSQRDA
ncbi:hypothetical protein DXG03_009231 [Asterophora parasitica]|uniref:Uncharacterized protein n=1 Tax=Asterophora parasitica TaxID=117018 RepID=A0A9P7G6F3_9AGAR|nr:hypothetical protein DXG03_009231 [Asterophora parasitica]